MMTGCGSSQIGKTDGKLSIVCTVFPQYDWLREIIGSNPGNIELTFLLDTGADLHSYQPTVADIVTINNSDMFVYIGGESDKWVDDVLKTATEEINAVDLMKSLGSAAKLESDEGIMEDHEHEEAHDHDEAGEQTEYDEHIWLSLKNAVTLCGVLTEELCRLDAANAEAYRANNKTYCEKLSALDKDFTNYVSGAKVKTIVCADRFPFMYLFEDYGLSYFAAFSGCSAESEASFSTVTGLAKKVDEYGLKFIFQTEKPLAADIAKTVIESTDSKDQKILTLDSIQSVTAADAADGKTYYTVMEQNINTLKEGLEG